MPGWQDYVDFMMMDTDDEGFQIIKQAYFLSIQGEFLCGSEDMPEEYDVEITNDDYTTSSIKCHEIANLMAAWDKNGKPSTKAGMRFNSNKFIPLMFDDDSNTWNFSAKLLDPEGSGAMIPGGATVAKTGKCFVIGIWTSDSEGKKKFSSECYTKVERVQAILKGADF